VESAITVLPRTQRDVVIMRLWDELSYAEIAAITGKSEAACKMTFSRALAALRTSLPPAAFILFITNPFA
jgi:DNA-directed RNA polymerase specialized sigma24 family protein